MIISHSIRMIQPKTWNVVPKERQTHYMMLYCMILYCGIFHRIVLHDTTIQYYVYLLRIYIYIILYFTSFIVYCIHCDLYHFPIFSEWQQLAACSFLIVDFCRHASLTFLQRPKFGCKDNNAPTGITHLVDFFHQLSMTLWVPVEELLGPKATNILLFLSQTGSDSEWAHLRSALHSTLLDKGLWKFETEFCTHHHES